MSSPPSPRVAMRIERVRQPGRREAPAAFARTSADDRARGLDLLER